MIASSPNFLPALRRKSLKLPLSSEFPRLGVAPETVADVGPEFAVA
jgi:hypothetical protein